MKLRLAAALLACMQAATAAPPQAKKLAKQARKAEAASQPAQAYLLYTQASALDPANRQYRGRAEALRTRAALAANVQPGDPQLPDLPEPYFDNFTAQSIALSGAGLEPPPELRAGPEPHDLDITGDYKTVFENAARAYGLTCVFDSDYEPGPSFRFRLDRADFHEALAALSAATDSFILPLGRSVFLVAKDNQQKRQAYEQTISVAVPVPQALTSQELIELAQVVRQAAGVEKLSWDTKTNSVVMRDRISRVLPAQAILHNLFAYRPQVVVDLQLIEVRKTDILNYGINLPNVFNIAFTGMGGGIATATGVLPANTANPFPFNSRTYNFISLASQGASGVMQNVLRGLYPTSLSLYSIGIAEANAMLNFSASLGRTILTAQLRSTDGQAATFHIGDKYPILTGSYSTGAAVAAQFTPAPSFSFEDLGITLKITPRIHGMESVSLDVDSEFKVLSGAVNLGNPIISNRKFKSVVDLAGGEWAVVAGLTQDTDSRTLSTTAGVNRVPILNRLFGQTAKQKDKSEILILMRPRLLDLPGNQIVNNDVRVGSESRPFSIW